MIEYNSGRISNSLSVLTIDEVALKLKLRGSEATMKWIVEKKISIYKERKRNLVYEIDIDVEIDKRYVRDLQIKYPTDWKDVYKKIAKDEAVYELVVLSLSGELCSSKSITKLRLTNDEDNELYKQLKG